MNKKKIILTLAVLLVIGLSFIGGQTYSKYITEVKGEGVAKVASWNFKVNGESESLKQVINLQSTVNNETLVNNKIAPGTKGNFVIRLDATGAEVGVKYDIKITNQNSKPTNLKFVNNGKTYNDIGQLLQEASGTINANDPSKIKEIKVDWEWPYEIGETSTLISQNDNIDTKEGMSGLDYTFEINVIGTQVMPNEI